MKEKKKIPKWLIIVTVFIFIGLIASIANDDKDEKKKDENKSDVSSTVEENVPDKTNIEITTLDEQKQTATETTTLEENETITTESSNVDEVATEDSEQDDEYTIQHGELISTITNNFDNKEIMIVKAKIESSLNNKMTIDQNYYNVADLIKNQGCYKFDEIQYWAVADMTSGDESKVISFTLNSDVIKKIYEEEIVDNQIGDYADDLWILPSLK